MNSAFNEGDEWGCMNRKDTHKKSDSFLFMNSSWRKHRQQVLVGESRHASLLAFNSPCFTSHVFWKCIRVPRSSITFPGCITTVLRLIFPVSKELWENTHNFHRVQKMYLKKKSTPVTLEQGFPLTSFYFS